ncbi:XRE family transcriptional regulator [Actinomadura sp. 7K507]|nr:XRE family transcriptional regulator [Actinomadura sp. 7K507]
MAQGPAIVLSARTREPVMSNSPFLDRRLKIIPFTAPVARCGQSATHRGTFWLPFRSGTGFTQLDTSGGQLMVNRKRLDPTESVAALFGAKLRNLRDKAGLSQAQLAEAVNYSNDTISKVETAAQAPSPELAARLDAHFNTGDTFQELQPLAAKEGIPTFFRPYAELENTADALRVYDHLVVSGLLQIEDYAREVMRPGQLPCDLDRTLATRMARQEVLRQDKPPWVVVLLTETAIRTVVGNKEITKAQLSRLLDL